MSENDLVSKALDLTPLDSVETSKCITTEVKNKDVSAKNDFEIARTNIHDLLQNGSVAVERLSQIADQSQHPRAYEVLAKLMDTLLNANEKLLDIQKSIREIEAKDKEEKGPKSVTNNLFVGSTTDLQKALNQIKKHESD